MLCPGYLAPAEAQALESLASPRVLQLLLALETAPDFPTARGLAIEVDRATHDELPVLPLWQVTDTFAWRARLEGPREEADALYEEVESWRIAPWYPRE
jgi:peptide/nickel transport system substrate-binding protein